MTEPPQDAPRPTPGEPPRPGDRPGPPSFRKPPHPPPAGGLPAYGQPQPGPYGQPPQGQPYPQPSYGPPAYGPAALRPVRGLGTAVVAVSAVATGFELLVALTGFGAGSSSALSATDGLGALSYLAWIAAYVVTCLWLVRVRRNAELLAPGFPHRRAWGWAWAGWLVPVVAWWFPYQVVRDAVTASATPSPGRLPRPPFGLWWGLWVAGQFLVNAGSQQALAPLHLLGAVLLAAGLAPWIKVVRTAVGLQAAAG